ncbi:hypothetical protein GCM10012279_19360 [Micromonospora yangpuensis]|nr:hypothetical protein GCM10012279_19360 [Micromonospora yangpuensis]
MDQPGRRCRGRRGSSPATNRRSTFCQEAAPDVYSTVRSFPVAEAGPAERGSSSSVTGILTYISVTPTSEVTLFVA